MLTMEASITMEPMTRFSIQMPRTLNRVRTLLTKYCDQFHKFRQLCSKLLYHLSVHQQQYRRGDQQCGHQLQIFFRLQHHFQFLQQLLPCEICVTGKSEESVRRFVAVVTAVENLVESLVRTEYGTAGI